MADFWNPQYNSTGGAADQTGGMESGFSQFLGGLDTRGAGSSDVLNVARGDDQYANKTRARIARAEWDDYKRRFQPVENQMMAYATSTDDGRSVGRAQESIAAGFDSAQGQYDRNMSRYGLNQTPEQDASYKRNMALNEASATASGISGARQVEEERRIGLMGGG